MTYKHNDILSGTPYFDDFQETKNFLKILFKPGYAVQARELTQLQTILQSQVSKFADHIFTDGSVVFGGTVSLSRVNYLRVTGNYQASRLRDVVGLTLRNIGNTVRARCIEVLPATASDQNPILLLQYLSAEQFTNGTIIYDTATPAPNTLQGIWESDTPVTALNPSSSNVTTMASVDSGIFYIDGLFVTANKQSIPLYTTNNGTRIFSETTASIGFDITRQVVTSQTDPTLKDPASGSYNFNAPGADRYTINLILNIYKTTPSDPNYIELARVVNSKLTYSKSNPSYSDILDLFARRTFDESGNYTVKPFNLELKEYIKRDRLSFVLTGNFTAFTYPSSTTQNNTVITDPSKTSKYPIQKGDILIRNNPDQTQYRVVSTIIVDTNNIQVEVVPVDSFVNENTYNDLPTSGATFTLLRIGSNEVEVGTVYTLNINFTVRTISDVSGSVSIADAVNGTADSSKFTASITPGKAYVYGYEHETTTPVDIYSDKPRNSTQIVNENIDSTIGNYLIIHSNGGTFNSTGAASSYDPTFDLNDFPDVNIQKKFISFLLPVPSAIYSGFSVRYWSPSIRKTVNLYTPSEGGRQYNSYNWLQPIGEAFQEVDHYYPHIVFLQQESTSTNFVLRKELTNTELENIDGFIEKRDANYEDSNYWSLIPNKSSVNEPDLNSNNSSNILDSSFETENNISRLVFNQSWSGDFITAYDLGFEGYDPAIQKYSRGYVDNDRSFVYQVDYLNIGNLITDSEGNITANNLRQNIRVKRANTRRWIPGSSADSLRLSDNTLFIKIPTSNIIFGPSLSETRGFSLPSSNDTIEHGVVFNPTSGYEVSYGSSIQTVIAEPNVVKITLQGPIDTNTTCNDTISSLPITKRNFGSYKEGDEVIQVYYKNGVGYTATGIVKKVIVNGNAYELFVKVTGNEAPSDFIPQSYESFQGTGGEPVYEGISALLQGTNIIDDGPICSCYTILGVTSFAEGNPTCGIFTEITFTEGYRQGQDYVAGDEVYQFDIDYIPLDNATEPANFDPEKILAIGTVMDWNKQTATLSLLVTKNEFKAKSGWIFDRNPARRTVRYGGRGWNLNKHNQTNQITSGSETYREIERVTGIFVDLDPNKEINFIDSFNTTENPSIKKRAYQVKTYEQQNSDVITASLPISAYQEYSLNGDPYTAYGQIISYTPPNPVRGPGYLLMEPDPNNLNTFAIRNGIPNPLIVTNGRVVNSVAQNVLIYLTNAKRILPLSSFYSETQTSEFVETQPGVENYTTVAQAKAKQLQYVGNNIYHLHLTEVKPFIMDTGPGSVKNYFSLENLSRVTRTKLLAGGISEEVEMFRIGDGTDTPQESKLKIQEPKNNSLLYEYPVGTKIKQLTNLTYELQIDLKFNRSTGNILTFNLPVFTGDVKFKGEKQVGTYSTIETSILKDYILVRPTSGIIDLTNTDIVIRTINGGKSIQLTFPSTFTLDSGQYTLICPMLVEGAQETNLRKKKKSRAFEVVQFSGQQGDNTIGIATLSKSDVISIDSCINLSTATEIPLSVLQLNGNQMNNVYELSTISATEKWRDSNISNGTNITTKPNGMKFLVSYTYYYHEGVGPIVSNSYQDGYDSIPEYLDKITNKKINLDSVVDFRPFQYRESGNVYTSGIFGIPTSGSAMYSTYSYYLPNKYSVILSRDKNFYIVPSVSSINPENPELPPNSMSLFSFEMPPYTVDASTVKTISINHQRYTMDDIRKLEERVENLEYTTRLSLLEQEARSLKILDTTVIPPVEKPKTSILVDSFVTHEVGDTLNPDYNICIDSDNNTLRPTFDAKFMELKRSSSNGVVFSKDLSPTGNNNYPPNLAYLGYTLSNIVDQRVSNGSFDVNPFSSSVWIGTMTATPDSITTFDSRTKPYIVSNVNGNNDTFENMQFSPLNNNLGAFGTKWNFWQTNWQGYQYKTQDIRSYYGRLTDYIKTQVPKTPKKLFGSKALNLDLMTYIPATTISFRVKGLKPNTVVYPVFDGVRVDSFIYGSSSSTLPLQQITTSSNGSVEFVFRLPEKTFKSGEKYFTLSDDPNGDKGLSLTYAEIKITNSAITPDSSDYLSVFGGNTIETKSNDMVDYRSVIAQTFFVDEREYPRGLYVKKVDLYFKTKDSEYPVTVELRPMRNGYPIVGPGSFSYPNASITKSADRINITEYIGNTTSGTAFEFDAPVHLLPGEHAIVISTNSNIYSLHSADYGSNSTTSGARISPVPYVGRLMRTNNSRTWTTYDNTDIAFSIHRCRFSTQGSIVLTDQELSGQFEHVYSYGNVNLAYSDLNSNQISCTIRTISQNELNTSIFDIEDLPVTLNTNVEFSKLKYYRYNGESFRLTIDLKSDGVISPILDIDSLRFIAVKNMIKKQTGGFSDLGITRYENELLPTSLTHEEYATSRYITKIVELQPDMLTKDCHVFFKMNKPRGTDVKVFIKRQYVNTDINIDEIEYEELELVSGSVVSTRENEYVDVYHKIPTASISNTIVRYNIKIVLIGNEDYSKDVPKIKDLKVITTP